MSRRRNRLLVVWAATLVVLLVLIGVLPGLTLLPERTHDLPRRAGSTESVLDLTWLFGFALLIYVIGLVLIAPRILHKRLVYVMIGVAMLALLAMGLIALAAAISLDPEFPAAAPDASPTVTRPETTPDPELLVVEPATFAPPPRWVGIAATVGIGLMLAAGLLGAVWRFTVWRRESAEQPLVQLAARAQAALDALYDGEEAGQVVLRCYFEMGRVLDQTQGIRRLETVTPREFAAQLTALGLPARAVETLTRLFERARYATSLSDDSAAQEAVASLQVIVDACREAA
jgi:hypothetical protein